MAGVKPGVGKSTEHSTNKQFGKGPGVTNVPLKKSPVNPDAPLIKDASGHKGAPVTRPNTPKSTENRVLLEQNQAGKSRTSSTFTAPRKESGGSAVECGYTKPGKM